MSDQPRDEWGETADERYARIEKRTNAEMQWIEYSRTEDRHEPTGAEKLAWRAGYSAGRSDYLTEKP